ncbi:MAG: hypothetical protein P1U42_04810 [Phycisphaerales bacterium]|nr:hypothetical protein [Phycisphaerales bacterium]
MKSNMTTILACTAFCALSANATIVQIDIVGSVDFGGVNIGQWASAGAGDSVVMSFQVDSNNFVDSGVFPVRGYEVIQSSFSLSIDGNTAGLAGAQPFGSPYFVLRNDDPAVDGFFLGQNIDGFPSGIATDESAQIADTFDALFQATYEGTRLDSLDILDAVGTYDFTGLSVFNWGLEDGPVQPMGFIFDHWSITAVPTPASLIAIAPLGLFAGRRRR